MLSELYLSLSRHTLQIGHVYTLKERKALLKSEISIRSELLQSQRLLSTMTHELSLLPVRIYLFFAIFLAMGLKSYLETGEAVSGGCRRS